MKYICTLITVTDMQQSKDFYVKVLKQRIRYDFGENVTFYGKFSLHLQSHFNQLIAPQFVQKGTNNGELYFENDQLEHLVQQLEKNEVKFLHKIVEQPWKQRVIRFYDPDENLIEVGEPMEAVCYRLHNNGLLTNEIQLSTGMSEKFIENSIKTYTFGKQKKSSPRNL